MTESLCFLSVNENVTFIEQLYPIRDFSFEATPNSNATLDSRFYRKALFIINPARCNYDLYVSKSYLVQNCPPVISLFRSRIILLNLRLFSIYIFVSFRVVYTQLNTFSCLGKLVAGIFFSFIFLAILSLFFLQNYMD